MVNRNRFIKSSRGELEAVEAQGMFLAKSRAGGDEVGWWEGDNDRHEGASDGRGGAPRGCALQPLPEGIGDD